MGSPILPLLHNDPMCRFRTALTALLLLAACSTSPEEENLESQKQDFFDRATIYYNAGRYVQAYQQAMNGLRLEPEHGGMNLIAGRALLMQRDLTQVAHALHYLEIAQENLNNYKADYAMAEWNLRYGSMLLRHAEEKEDSYRRFPAEDPQAQAEALERCSEQRLTAMGHLRTADSLLDEVLITVPEDLATLELSGQVNALIGHDGEAMAPLQQALNLLGESRQFLNRRLATDDSLSVEQEKQLRNSLENDIEREVAIRFLLAGIHHRASSFQAEEHEYTLILALRPAIPEAIHSRGLCRSQLGRMAEAAADMREFISITELDFDSPQVQQAMDIITEFDNLQGS